MYCLKRVKRLKKKKEKGKLKPGLLPGDSVKSLQMESLLLLQSESFQEFMLINSLVSQGKVLPAFL